MPNRKARGAKRPNSQTICAARTKSVKYSKKLIVIAPTLGAAGGNGCAGGGPAGDGDRGGGEAGGSGREGTVALTSHDEGDGFSVIWGCLIIDRERRRIAASTGGGTVETGLKRNSSRAVIDSQIQLLRLRQTQLINQR